MFRKIRQYEKPIFIVITLVIALSFIPFGIDIDSLVSRKARETVASFADANITGQQFQEALVQWYKLFQMSERVSPKAKKILMRDQPTDNDYFKYAKHPIWDAIYSLREDVVKLDQKLELWMGEPNRQREVLRGNLNPVELEYQFYMALPETEREKLRVSSREGETYKQDVLNMLMLLHDAERWNIQISDNEVEDFMYQTRQLFGEGEAYGETLKHIGIFEPDLAGMGRKALTILKYLHARCNSVNILAETIYDTYSDLHSQYQLQWVNFPKVEGSRNYTEERLNFYDDRHQADPDYFKVPNRADFDYIFVNNTFFEQETIVTQQEVAEYLEKDRSARQEEEETARSENMSREEEAEQKIREKKAAEKAKEFLENVHTKIMFSPYAEAVDLKAIAKARNLVYNTAKQVVEEDFLTQSHVGTQEAQSEIYKKLEPGRLSGVLPFKKQGYFIVRLLTRAPSRTIAREEVAKDDTIFLERYYQKNKKEFTTPLRYRLGYVLVDYNTVKQNLLVSTPVMQEFYEKYKEQLYKKDTKDSAAQYLSFQDVRDDVEMRVSNLLRSQELQKIYIFYQMCKERGEDLDLDNVTQELAKQIMLEPESLKYVESPNLLSQAELERDNPTGDPHFRLVLAPNAQVSEVMDSPTGRYFYKLLETAPAKEKQFSAVRDEVKAHFLKSQALARARRGAEEFTKKYQEEFAQLKNAWEKDAAPTRTGDAELHKLGSRLLETLAWQQQLPCKTSPVFNNLRDVEELKYNEELYKLLPDLKTGELSAPILDTRLGQVLLVRLITRHATSMAEIPRAQWEYIRNILWERAYRAQRSVFLNHQELSRRFNLHKKLEAFEEELE